jgi:C-8 sterol isomerase
MSYVMDPDVLGEIVRGAVHLPLEAALDQITRDLDARFPGRVYTGPRKWIFNNAGGAMGQIALLYASLNEYVLIFGTPIGTEGHSGRYATDVYDYMIDGEMLCYVEGDLEATTFKPGDCAHLGRARAKGYRVKDRAWMLEYSRGPVFLMLPFGLADTVFSTLDMTTLARTLGTYGKFVARSMLARA